jgi:hypothetical protein
LESWSEKAYCAGFVKPKVEEKDTEKDHEEGGEGGERGKGKGGAGRTRTTRQSVEARLLLEAKEKEVEEEEAEAGVQDNVAVRDRVVKEEEGGGSLADTPSNQRRVTGLEVAPSMGSGKGGTTKEKPAAVGG